MAATRVAAAASSKPRIAPGARRAAIAAVALGPEAARSVFSVLEPEEVRTILEAAHELEAVRAQEVAETLEAWLAEFDDRVVGVGQQRVLREAAAAAIGPERLAQMLGEEVEPDAAKRLLRAVAERDPERFARLLSREHPQVAAAVLALLPPAESGAVLGHLDVGLRADLIRRIAGLRAVPSDLVAEIAELIGRELSGPDALTALPIPGEERAVALVKAAPADAQGEILEMLGEQDEELAESIRKKLFVFEDILRLHSRHVQLLLREVDTRTLTLALKSASEELSEHILSNMSSRAAEMLLDDMEALGPVTVSQVMEAQQEIVDTVLRLADEGRIDIRAEEAV